MYEIIAQEWFLKKKMYRCRDYYPDSPESWLWSLIYVYTCFCKSKFKDFISKICLHVDAYLKSSIGNNEKDLKYVSTWTNMYEYFRNKDSFHPHTFVAKKKVVAYFAKQNTHVLHVLSRETSNSDKLSFIKPSRSCKFCLTSCLEVI